MTLSDYIVSDEVYKLPYVYMSDALSDLYTMVENNLSPIGNGYLIKALINYFGLPLFTALVVKK